MGRLGWIWQPSHAPQMFCNTKNRATLGAVHQNCASPPISLSVPWDPGPALSRVVWQLLEPSTIASYADKEGESQGWCKEQLCALLFTGPGAEAWRADGQCITIGVHRYETCWLPTAFEIKLGKTMFSVGRGARRWMSHIFPFRQSPLSVIRMGQSQATLSAGRVHRHWTTQSCTGEFGSSLFYELWEQSFEIQSSAVPACHHLCSLMH